MVDAPISRVRLRDLVCLGRGRLVHAVAAGAHEPTASRRRRGTDADGIAAATPAHPGRASSRPGAAELVASTI